MSSCQSEPINGNNKRQQGLVGVNGTFFWMAGRAQQYCLVTIFGMEEVQIISLTGHLTDLGLAKKR